MTSVQGLLKKSKSLLSVSLSSAIAISMLAACSPESPKLVELPKEKKEKVKDTDETSSFNPKVDILFVIDDSGSMDAHQQNLSANIPQFAKAITSSQVLDYHIGVITSTFDGGSIANCGGWRACGEGVLNGGPTKTKFIERSTPNGVNILAENLLVGTNGSGNERFFSPVRASLTSPLVNGLNAGFYRPEASLVVIFLTDADDQSDRFNAQDYTNFLVNLKNGDAKKVLSYGVIIPSADTSGTCNRSGEPVPVKLEDAVTMGGGSTFSLCDPNFGKKLGELAEDVAQKVAKTMYLTRPPVVDTISVTYGTQVIPNDKRIGWVYDPARNALIFGDDLILTVQAPGTELEVNFVAAQYE